MKQFVTNRKGQKICVVVDNADKSHELAFVEHGLGGSKDKGPIPVIIQAFVDMDYTVVSFDTANAFGESEGDYQYASATNSYEDLDDVIKWASTQEWFRDKFALAGHSLGGIASAWYAEQFPEKVSALAPIATVVSGKLSLELAKTYAGEENYDHWQTTGLRRTFSRDGSVEKILPWSHMEDRLKYDLLPQASRLTMPVLLVVGTNDDRTPLDQQKIFYDALSQPKKLHIIEGAEHSFYKEHERDELKQAIQQWLSTK